VAKKRKAKAQKRYYGLTKLKKGQKYCWLSLENKHGWALGLALDNRTVWLRNIRFASRQEVEAVLGKSKVVFIKLKHPDRIK